jgi:hypothetical protein
VSIIPSNADEIAITQNEGHIPMKIVRLTAPTIAVSIPLTSRWSWLWLVIGAALLPFTSIQPSLAIATWTVAVSIGDMLPQRL